MGGQMLQPDLNRTGALEANHVAVLGLKPLLYVKKWSQVWNWSRLSLSSLSAQGMPFPGPVCTSEDATSVRCLIEKVGATLSSPHRAR